MHCRTRLKPVVRRPKLPRLAACMQARVGWAVSVRFAPRPVLGFAGFAMPWGIAKSVPAGDAGTTQRLSTARPG